MTEASTGPIKKKSALTIIGIVGAVLALVGVAAWITQLSGGMAQTGMRNYDSWGLYITNFMFFVGLSAGGLIISSVPKAFGIQGFGNISKIAVWTALSCTVAAIAFVVVDLGNPLRIWELFLYSNLTSPLMWDIIVLTVYLTLSIVLIWAMYGEEKGRVSHTALRVLSVISVTAAVLVHSVTAWIFGLQPAHEMWHTALLGPWFVSSALVCGTALVLVVVIALRKAGRIELDQSNVVKMAKLLGVFVLVDLYFFGCDLLTEGYPMGEGAEIVSMLTTGALAPFFWTEVVGCIAAAVVCFTPKLRTSGLIVAASVLAILGIFCKRVQLLVGGFQLPNLDMAIAANDFTVTADTVGSLIYWPQPIEFVVSVGVIGLALAIMCFGFEKICK